MKIILVVLAVIALWWLLRATFRPRERPPNATAADPSPKAMLACAHCGVHLPRDEVLPGRGGVFCGAAHRAAFEQAHPGS